MKRHERHDSGQKVTVSDHGAVKLNQQLDLYNLSEFGESLKPWIYVSTTLIQLLAGKIDTYTAQVVLG